VLVTSRAIYTGDGRDDGCDAVLALGALCEVDERIIVLSCFQLRVCVDIVRGSLVDQKTV